MSVIEDLNLINQYKGDIKQAIIDKGVDMTGTPLSSYAGKIGEIQGGSDPVTEELTVTNNGVFTPGEGVDGYSKVTVDVPKEGDDTVKDLIERVITSINIPAEITKIGNSAFAYCSGLTYINIPDLVTSIGYQAFYSCSGLTSINIPDLVTSIGNQAFYGCSNLTSINIPDLVTSIGDLTFYGCSKLTSVTIPNLVTRIGVNAFNGCRSLIYIYFGKDRTTVPTLGGSSAIPGNVVAIYVPESLVDSFKSATNWAAHANKIVAIPE